MRTDIPPANIRSRDIVPLVRGVLFRWSPTVEATEQAIRFADELEKEKAGLYEDTSQGGLKAWMDACYGKIGEWAVFYMLRTAGIVLNPPEDVIRGRRVFTPDLRYVFGGRQCALHVKTQTVASENRYDQAAWVWQAGSTAKRRDPLLDHYDQDDYFVGCTFDEYEGVVHVRTCVTLGFLHRYELFVTKKVIPKHRGQKVVVRLIDIFDKMEESRGR